MSEAVEYRLKSLQRYLMALIAMMAICTGSLIVVLQDGGAIETTYYGLGVAGALFLINAVGMLRVRSMETRGWARAFFGLIATEPEDPPLDEWEERLAQEDVFEVDE